MCPGGIFSASAAEKCGPQAQEPSCKNVVPALNNCEDRFCEGDCGASSSSSGGGSSGGTGRSSGGPPSSCLSATYLECSGGATGFSCSAAEYPTMEDPALLCGTPQVTEDEYDYCCFTGFDGSSSTCVFVSDDGLPCGTFYYGFRCVSGDDPTTFDASLMWEDLGPDPDGVQDDYCCSLG